MRRPAPGRQPEPPFGTVRFMAADAAAENAQTASCPHCHKPFSAELIAGGVERHRGFKCPHCKLFVPESRAEESEAEDAPLSRSGD